MDLIRKGKINLSKILDLLYDLVLNPLLVVETISGQVLEFRLECFLILQGRVYSSWKFGQFFIIEFELNAIQEQVSRMKNFQVLVKLNAILMVKFTYWIR